MNGTPAPRVALAGSRAIRCAGLLACALFACSDDSQPQARGDSGPPDAADSDAAERDAANQDVDDAGTDDADETDADGTDADQTDADTDSTDVADGSADDTSPDVEPPPDPLTVSWCYRAQMNDPTLVGPDYDQFGPTVGSHCLGTNHQDITDVEKIVFVGDSVTTGTPPTQPGEYYTTLLVERVQAQSDAELVVENHSGFGRRVDDLLLAPHQMLIEAFPEVEPLRTLVVFTIGGNDVFAWAEDAAEGMPMEEIEAQVDAAIALLGDALDYLADPERFPNGVYVVFSNVFEFTDGTGDTGACPLAEGIGLGEPWPEGRAPVVRFNEAFMALAVEHGFDMIFMLEQFCGHGFKRDDPTGQCYLGPDAEPWFDFTCIHPNPVGHAVIADMFASVVEE